MALLNDAVKMEIWLSNRFERVSRPEDTAAANKKVTLKEFKTWIAEEIMPNNSTH